MLYMTPYHSKYEHNLPFGLSAPSSPIFKRPLILALHLYERCSNRELQHEFWVALSSYLMHVFNPLVSGATELHSPVKYEQVSGPSSSLPTAPELRCSDEAKIFREGTLKIRRFGFLWN